MSKLSWSELDSRVYETGVDRGVFYPQKSPGVSWNGIVSIEETPSDAEIKVVYWDGLPYRKPSSSGSFSAILSAYTYPLEFEEHNEDQSGFHIRQRLKSFGLSYRTTTIGQNGNVGYKIHLVYNALAAPSSEVYESSLDDTASFKWELETTPILVDGIKPASHFVVDSTLAYPWAVAELEDILYGTVATEPRLPTIDELIVLFENSSILKITDHGDGTWTAEGPDNVVKIINDTTFEINSPSVVPIDSVTYEISSL